MCLLADIAGIILSVPYTKSFPVSESESLSTLSTIIFELDSLFCTMGFLACCLGCCENQVITFSKYLGTVGAQGILSPTL